jgi:hypothetical protein
MLMNTTIYFAYAIEADQLRVGKYFFANACIFKIYASTFVACSFTGALIKKGGGTGPVMP